MSPSSSFTTTITNEHPIIIRRDQHNIDEQLPESSPELSLRIELSERIETEAISKEQQRAAEHPRNGINNILLKQNDHKGDMLGDKVANSIRCVFQNINSLQPKSNKNGCNYLEYVQTYN